MKARNRAIAFQAVGVAVLSAVVFLAFLRPSEPRDLSGIEAPGDPPSVVNPDPDDPRGHNRHGGEGPGNQGGGGGTDAGAGDTSSRPASGDGNTPTDYQYGDIVARLLGRVGPGAESPADVPAD